MRSIEQRILRLEETLSVRSKKNNLRESIDVDPELFRKVKNYMNSNTRSKNNILWSAYVDGKIQIDVPTKRELDSVVRKELTKNGWDGLYEFGSIKTNINPYQGEGGISFWISPESVSEFGEVRYYSTYKSVLIGKVLLNTTNRDWQRFANKCYEELIPQLEDLGISYKSQEAKDLLIDIASKYSHELDSKIKRVEFYEDKINAHIEHFQI